MSIRRLINLERATRSESEEWRAKSVVSGSSGEQHGLCLYVEGVLVATMNELQ